MKIYLPFIRFSYSQIILALSLFTVELNAQSNALELKATTINPEENGPSLTNQVIGFRISSDDPFGNISASYSPTLSVTFSLCNQQYTLPVEQISTASGLSFGASPNSSAGNALESEIFPLINSVGSPTNTDFVYSPRETSHSRIDINSNRALEIFTSARALYNIKAATDGRYYFGDLTITFNQPVANPILHIGGLGGFYSSLGFTTELEMQNTGIILSKLSGSDELVISEGSKILNSAADPGSVTGTGAASGSVLATGPAITSLTFRLYLRGDGDKSEWGNSAIHTGDAWLIGVSLTAPVSISTNMYTGIKNSGIIRCPIQEGLVLDRKTKVNSY